MNRRRLIRSAASLMLPAVVTALATAQPRSSVVVIGLLDAGERLEWWDAFRQQLREFGYVEGRNVRIEARYAKGNLDALPSLVQELLKLNVALIVTSTSAAAVAAAHATRTIPIVMASGGDQVSRGLASTLARPGGNVTGVASFSSDLMAKRFALLREVVPKSARIAALWQSDFPSMASIRELESSAAAAKVAFQSSVIHEPTELADIFSAMTRDRVDALVVLSGPLVFAERKRIAELALKHRLPTACSAAEYADAGALLTYGPSYPRLFRRAAWYVDKVLKGASPADLPIEQPTTFELVVNAGTARSLGLAVPATMLARADRVIG